MNPDIAEAKRRLPLPELMARLGFGDRARNKARCPFHLPDNHPSFSVYDKEGQGQYHWRCFTGCGSGDQIDFLAKVKGIDNKEATKEFLLMAGVTSGTAKPPKQVTARAEPKPAITPRPLGLILDTVEGFLRRYVVFQLQAQVSVIAHG
jgi:DNA primase